MSPIAQTALSTEKSQLNSQAFVKADSCLSSAAEPTLHPLHSPMAVAGDVIAPCVHKTDSPAQPRVLGQAGLP